MISKNLQRLVVRSQSTVAKTTPRPLSNAYIGDLAKRWETMPKDEQGVLIEDLKTRMTLPWQELTPAEKKAVYYISYGEWGPRKPLYGPGEANKVFWGTVAGLAAGVGLFWFIRYFTAPESVTMNRDWQMKSDEYLKSKNANPFTGYSQVQ